MEVLVLEQHGFRFNVFHQVFLLEHLTLTQGQDFVPRLEQRHELAAIDSAEELGLGSDLWWWWRRRRRRRGSGCGKVVDVPEKIAMIGPVGHSVVW